jgi:hypothetical protein
MRCDFATPGRIAVSPCSQKREGALAWDQGPRRCTPFPGLFLAGAWVYPSLLPSQRQVGTIRKNLRASPFPLAHRLVRTVFGVHTRLPILHDFSQFLSFPQLPLSCSIETCYSIIEPPFLRPRSPHCTQSGTAIPVWNSSAFLPLSHLARPFYLASPTRVPLRGGLAPPPREPRASCQFRSRPPALRLGTARVLVTAQARPRQFCRVVRAQNAIL